MVAVRAARGLSPGDLDRIRETVASGRKPKVVFTDAAGQIAGQLGQVVALTDPAVSDEWLMVRFGRDELPFSPADLAIPPKPTPAKAARARSAPPSVPPAVADANAEPVVPAPAVPSPREETPVPAASPSAPAVPPPAAGRTNGRTVAAAKTGSARATSIDTGRSVAAKAPAPADRVAPDAPASTAVPAAVPAPADRRPAARKTAKSRPPASLTVTVNYADGEWTVGATQGAKVLAKPYVIRASEALRMVALLDVPTVHEAVEEIVVTARQQAEQQAERLRAELAEIESRLAELRDPV